MVLRQSYDLTPVQFASGADWESDMISCAGFRRIEFWIRWAALASHAGTLRLRGGPGNLFTNPETFIIDDLGIATGDGTYGDWPTIGAAAGVACIVVANPMAFMGIGFVHSGGAVSANIFDVYAVRSR